MLLPITAIVSICCVLGSEVLSCSTGERVRSPASEWNHIGRARSIVPATRRPGEIGEIGEIDEIDEIDEIRAIREIDAASARQPVCSRGTRKTFRFPTSLRSRSARRDIRGARRIG
ncbi:hypothetical protein [Burkholderia sp. MSMB1498]|uniref:hypothetical protein n=1 Tax=Burkholderia sp. MSMB1498 TaxID=1637842 RepID=UPI0012E333E8|nr:hypothetical protein [Burkholderia sp. MSMB1498]